MVYILFSIIIILPVLLGIGKLTELIFGKIFDGISSKLLFGIFSISLVFTILSFFFPLNLMVESITLFVGISSFFFFKIYLETWVFLKKNKFSFFIILLIIAFFSSYFPFILDHFGYYIPTIKWLSEVGLVKGISNLDLLLGQMSIWHIFQAGFSHFSDPFLRINSVVLVVYLIYILEKKSWIHLFFLPILFLFLQSPSPDLPVIVFSLILLNELFLKNKKSAILFAISAFVFSIKPTMIWLPIIVFLYNVLVLKSGFKFIFLGSIVLTLFIIKNIYTFGYPVFPVQFADFNVFWKPNSDLLKKSAQTAIEKTYDMQYSYSDIQKFSTFDYIKNWLFLVGIKAQIHWLFILSLIGFSIYCFKKNKKILYLILISIFIKSILILIFSAQYRFFIDVFFVIVFVIFYGKFTKKTALTIFTISSLFVGIFLSFPNLVKTFLPSFKLGNYLLGFQKSQILEPLQFQSNHFKTYEIGNLKFNISYKNSFNFDTPIPAISPTFIQEDIDAGIFPQKIGKDWKEGFIWKRISLKDQQKLKDILKENNTF